MNVIKERSVIISWPLWHFFLMPKFLFGVWGNYLTFTLDYFSIPTLLMTLLSPWRNYRWRYPRGLDIWLYFTVFISNIFSRLVGAICRLVLIIFGFVALAVVLVAGLFVILFWIALPAVWVLLIVLMLYV